MGKQAELERLDRAIKDGLVRITTIKSNLELLDKEIATLTDMKKLLKDNLKCLKSKNIIPIATEFKKAKEDLLKAERRLIMAGNERADFQRALDYNNQVIGTATLEIEKIKKSGENNVLRGNFGKKDHG